MAYSYYKAMRVPTWVVLQQYEDKEKMAEVINWFKDAEAFPRLWPSTTFKNTLMSFKNKGWHNEIPASGEYFLNPQLLAMAAAEHVKTVLGVTSHTSFRIPVLHTESRRIKSDVDYVRIFDELLMLQSQIVLSQMFQVGEVCHQEGRKNHRTWLTVEPCNKNLLTTISDRVITVGEGDDANINTKNVGIDQVQDYLEREFGFILSHN